MEQIKLIECPRDAMQGIHEFIPTDLKAKYINSILKCGFDTIDFGSFVSPKAMPQMADTATLLSKLELTADSKLLAIVVNQRGAFDACNFEEINYLGFPFSVSQEFQRRNTNSSIEQSLVRVEAIQNMALKNGKETVVYLSMGFGNPYGEYWDPELVIKWCEILYTKLGIKIQALSDTIGSANEETIQFLFSNLIPALKDVEFGAHLHCRPENALKVTKAAYDAGCRRFDGAIKGFGGCPMAKDDLTGNMPTEKMVEWFDSEGILLPIDKNAFNYSMEVANEVFKS